MSEPPTLCKNIFRYTDSIHKSPRSRKAFLYSRSLTLPRKRVAFKGLTPPPRPTPPLLYQFLPGLIFTGCTPRQGEKKNHPFGEAPKVSFSLVFMLEKEGNTQSNYDKILLIHLWVELNRAVYSYNSVIHKATLSLSLFLSLSSLPTSLGLMNLRQS